MKFKEFMKTKGAIGAIFMAVFYAVAMLGIFLSGYTAIPGNMDELKIALVNDDQGDAGKNIAKELNKSLPFKTIESDITNKEAMNKLEKNDLALVIHIPENFSSNAKKGKTANIDYTVNEASATMVSSSMSAVVNQINNQLSANFSEQTAKGILMNFNLPEEQAEEMSKQIENSYVGNYKVMNDVPDGMHHNMLAMFLTMACYVGAMIGSMLLVGSFKASRGKASKTKLFVYVQLAAILVGVISGICAIGIGMAFTQADLSLLIPAFAQQILLYWVAFNFTAIPTFFLGEGGMILNIPVLLVQTIANGATMPRDMMYPVFEWISYITPMYYSVQSYFAMFYGSIGSLQFIWKLALVGVVAMVINILIVRFIHKPLPVDPKPEVKKEEKKKAEATV
ncbi:YhgE/Pip domain-containing protein [Kurthia sibirica]|uniref:ABC-2 type transporter transmembrane domain-containing protein n=1 Tax=Kurthia sibirica TaxID=202750 RepID=A0A2U3AJH2_9BACL|nr:ABC transporter permease [Kurthia sibirica]PWI24716.1 hypothetical protein DEX24_12195 [Kurthia sibirica]GEK34744.1 hypothetical protein KSI01_22770 [Kurthia sibirica]